MVAARPAPSRSREQESEATRRTILDCAEALLASGGEERLSIRELCLRAGVTPPTVYHHFGAKAALVDRVVDECFEELDAAFAKRSAPKDPVERLRWSFDRYVEHGVRHPTHYRLMFLQSRGRRPTPIGLAAYDRLRRMVAAVDAARRLTAPVEPATAAFWSAVHGVTSLLIAGFWSSDAPAIALTRDSMIAQLTQERRAGARKEQASKRAIPGATRSDAPGVATAIGAYVSSKARTEKGRFRRKRSPLRVPQPRSGEHRTGPMRQHERTKR